MRLIIYSKQESIETLHLLGATNSFIRFPFVIESLIQELEVNQIHFLDNFDNLKIKNMMNLMKKGEVCLFENIQYLLG